MDKITEFLDSYDASQNEESVSEKTQQYLSVLNEEQKEAVMHEGSPLLILAGAGSGKTRVITTKIAYLIAEKHFDPYSILAVTFTKKAANEMHERAIQLEERASHAQIRTFHSFGAWFLRMNAFEAGIDPKFTVYDDDDMVTLLCKAVPKLTKQQASHFAHKISLAKDYCMTADDPKITEIASEQEFPEIYQQYQKRLRETGNVDFGDLIMLPYLVLKNNENIRRRMHQRFKVIMVDEYQDSNVAQFLLLQELSGVKENSGTYVCVVGDDDQSIYKFRGAEIQNILTFKNKFPGTKVIKLEKNYRSKSEILQIADNVVRNNQGRLGKTLHAERGKGKAPVLAFLPNQDEEANFCADLIQLAHENGSPYSDWAILYRTNAQSLTFETTFMHKKIPYAVIGSLKFYEREEIKDLLAFLALIANPRDEIAFRRIINKPARGVGGTTQEKLVDAMREKLQAGQAQNTNLLETSRTFGEKLTKKAREGINHFVEIMDKFYAELQKNEQEGAQSQVDKPNLSVLIDLISEKSGLKTLYESEDEISGSQRTANMQELSNSAVLYPCTSNGLLEFLDHIELDRTLETGEEEADTDKVTLITLHNTKGLEFNRVIITGIERGIFPREDDDPAELEEERRLCYVGITRAKNELYLTSCSMRRMYGRTAYMEPSPFLKEMNPALLKIIGRKPSSFRTDSSFHGGDYGTNGLSHPDMETDPIKQKYSRGKQIYHDDYGYGVIISTLTTDDDEYAITVQFENGGKKRFLPKYQSSALLVVE